MNFITDIVLESGVTRMIEDYKKSIEKYEHSERKRVWNAKKNLIKDLYYFFDDTKEHIRSTMPYIEDDDKTLKYVEDSFVKTTFVFIKQGYC